MACSRVQGASFCSVLRSAELEFGDAISLEFACGALEFAECDLEIVGAGEQG